MQDLNSIIQRNIGLIKAQLKRYNLRDDPDAESIGYEALYNAAETFDETKGFKFSTYATCCIYNALGCHIRSLNKKRKLDVVSFNTIAYTDDEGDHEHLEFIADTYDMTQEILKEELFKKVQEAYKQAYSRLTNEKHKTIIDTWHKSEYTMTLTELAKIAGCSQPNVSQVINTFKYQLRKRLEEYYHD